MRIFSFFLFALLLTGCQTKKLPVANVSTVTSSFAGAEGVDVYAGKRRNGENVPDYRGDQLVEVRSYTFESVKNSSRKKKVEFTGARCSLSGSGFNGNVTTPGKVRVPIYGHASSELAVRCVADGHQPKIQTVRAYNKTKTDRRSGAAGGGLLGVVVVAAVNAASDETKHVFLYRPINVEFKN